MERENDETRGTARPAVIIANIRSGGTFLAHCLSNHPQVFCDRSEGLHHQSIWHAHLSTDRPEVLWVLTHQPGYQVSMVKLTYFQAFKGEVSGWIGQTDPLVLWLGRENKIRQAVSVILNRWARRGRIKRPQHTFTQPAAVRVAIPPEMILRWARRLAQLDGFAQDRLGGNPRVLRLTYAQVVGGELAQASHLPIGTGRRICEFLGVRAFDAMTCDLKRVNPLPLRRMLRNWDEVRVGVARSEFKGCLADGG